MVCRYSGDGGDGDGGGKKEKQSRQLVCVSIRLGERDNKSK